MATDENFNLPGVLFRFALQDDKTELLEMSKDVYGGLDYLPCYYNEWIEEAEKILPRRFNFVGVLEDQLVAFFSLLFFSGKTSMIMSAMRVHPNFRGRNCEEDG